MTLVDSGSQPYFNVLGDVVGFCGWQWEQGAELRQESREQLPRGRNDTRISRADAAQSSRSALNAQFMFSDGL